MRGHHKARLDPLGILDADLDNKVPVELTLDHYGWTDKDLGKEFSTGPGILPHFKAAGIEKITLQDLIATMERIYCDWRLPLYTIKKDIELIASIQAGISELNICTFRTGKSVIGFVLALRYQSHSSIL